MVYLHRIQLNTLDCEDNSCFSKGRKSSLNALFSRLAFQVPRNFFLCLCVFDSFQFTVFIFFLDSVSVSLPFCLSMFLLDSLSFPTSILQFLPYLAKGQYLTVISSFLQCLKWCLYFIICNAMGSAPIEN